MALSADGQAALVGAPAAGSGNGAADLYGPRTTAWSATPAASFAGTGSEALGTSVALSADGQAALVGAPGAGSGDGAAYLYAESAGAWPSTPAASFAGTGSEELGWSVALSADGQVALVGAPYASSGNGAAFVYAEAAGAWPTTPTASFAGTGGGTLGWSVALSADGQAALVGAPVAGYDNGAAYVYPEAAGAWPVHPGGQLRRHRGRGARLVGGPVGRRPGRPGGAPYASSGNGAAFVYAEAAGAWPSRPRRPASPAPGARSSAPRWPCRPTARPPWWGPRTPARTTAPPTSTTRRPGPGPPPRRPASPAPGARPSAPRWRCRPTARPPWWGPRYAGSINGAAYVYAETAGAWPSTPAASFAGTGGEALGHSVALSADGQAALVGARYAGVRKRRRLRVHHPRRGDSRRLGLSGLRVHQPRFQLPRRRPQRPHPERDAHLHRGRDGHRHRRLPGRGQLHGGRRQLQRALAQRAGRLGLFHLLRRGERGLRGQPGPPHHHRFEPGHDLRGPGAGHRAGLLGLRGGPGRVRSQHPADVRDDGHRHFDGRHLPCHLLGGGQPRLHHRLRRRFSNGRTGPPHHHRFEPGHDLRGPGAGHRAGLLGLRGGPGRVRSQHPADLRDDGHRHLDRRHLPSSCSGAASPDYTIGYVGGSVTVGPAPLTITASSPAMTYGGPVPAIEPVYSGFVAGQDASALSTQPTCATTATVTSTVGTYPASCSGAASADYTIGYVGGTVSVGTAVLTITATSTTMTYGGPVPEVTPTYSTVASLATAPACSTTATLTSTVGTYPATCSGAVAPDYAIGYAPGTVTVTPATLTVTASSASFTQGGAVPAITPSYAGFVAGDSAVSLTTAPTCSTNVTSSSPPGTYPSTCSGGSEPNYAISYVAGTLTVNAAPASSPVPPPTITTTTAPLQVFPSADVTYPNGAIVAFGGSDYVLAGGRAFVASASELGSLEKVDHAQVLAAPTGASPPTATAPRPGTLVCTKAVTGDGTIYVAGTDGELHGFSTPRQFFTDGYDAALVVTVPSLAGVKVGATDGVAGPSVTALATRADGAIVDSGGRSTSSPAAGPSASRRQPSWCGCRAPTPPSSSTARWRRRSPPPPSPAACCSARPGRCTSPTRAPCTCSRPWPSWPGTATAVRRACPWPAPAGSAPSPLERGHGLHGAVAPTGPRGDSCARRPDTRHPGRCPTATPGRGHERQRRGDDRDPGGGASRGVGGTLNGSAITAATAVTSYR